MPVSTCEFFIERVLTLPEVDGVSGVIRKVFWTAVVSVDEESSMAQGETWVPVDDPATLLPIATTDTDTIIARVVELEGGQEFKDMLINANSAYLIELGEDKQLQEWDQPFYNSADPESRLQKRRKFMECSNVQAAIALENEGLLSAAQGTVALASLDTQLAFERAQVFKRNSPMVAAMQVELGLTDAQVDMLFEKAKRIEV